MVALRRAVTLRFCLNKLFSVVATIGSDYSFKKKKKKKNLSV